MSIYLQILKLNNYYNDQNQYHIGSEKVIVSSFVPDIVNSNLHFLETW